MHFNTGDQNVLWDAVLKLRLLSDLGHTVTHDVHTADHFSRPPEGSDKPLVTNEAYLQDGNVRRWTACLEAALFLGRMPLSPTLLQEVGLSFDAAGRIAGQESQQAKPWAVEHLTQADWLGLSHPDADIVAHGLSMDEILPVFQQLRRPLRADANLSFGPQSLPIFDKLFNLSEGRGEEWPTVAVRHLRQVLDAHGAHEVAVTTSVDLFSVEQFDFCQSLLTLFLRDYELARSAYNEALKTNGEKVRPLAAGELPFYAVIKQGKRLVRQDLLCQPGDSVQDVLRAAQHSGRIVAVLGKALMLFLELCRQGSLVLPERGSPYIPQSIRFAQIFQHTTGVSLGLQPVYWLRINALDALRSVSTSFKLPEYLQQPFGKEVITGCEFGERWREVVAQQRALSCSILAMPTELVALGDHLRHHHLLGEPLIQTYISISSQLKEYRDIMQREIRLLRAVHLSSEDFNRQLSLKKAEHAVRLDLKGLQICFTRLEELIASRIAWRVRDHLSVAESLPYWNCRPFSHWVFSVAGWYEAIREQVDLSPQAIDSEHNSLSVH